MTHSIKLSSDKTFDSIEGKSILDSALANKVVLEYSCRNGRCAVCKTELISGETKILNEEISLTEQEKQTGFILTCCREAKSDLSLEATDISEIAHLQIKTLPCRINKITQLNDEVLEVTLRLPPNAGFNYLAGQYIDIIKGDIRRSYSIANAPKEDAEITLQIKKFENGMMSDYWFNQAKENDLLRFEGPLGTFFLRESNKQNLVFLATGTGIAPIKAIFEQLEKTEATDKNIYIYWGGRTEKDLYLQPKIANNVIKFIPVFSRPPENWQGRSGYVQQALLEDKINLQDTTIYACGSEAMIHSAKELLTQNGLDKKHFYSDAFVEST